MKTKHLKGLNWVAIKSRIIRKKCNYGSGSDDNLHKGDEKLIKDAATQDIISNIDETNLLSYFDVKQRNGIYYSGKSRVINDEVIDAYKQELNKIKITDCWFLNWLSGNVINEFKEMILDLHKKTMNLKGYSVQDLLNENKISRYSIPYGETRTLENNHNGTIVISCIFKGYGGFFIVKTKRKYMGMEVQCATGRGETICPVSLSKAMDGIKAIRKSTIKESQNDELFKDIPKMVMIEKQKEIEAEI